MSENKKHPFFLIARIFGSAFIGMLGCLSGYFLINLLNQIFNAINTLQKLREATLGYYLVMGLLLIGFGWLTYFLFLLSYRAFSGQGRKKDGRLVSPLTLKVFLAIWSLVLGIAVVINTVDKNFWAAFFALLSLGICIKILVHGDAVDPE
jgi:hypothetical protein